MSLKTFFIGKDNKSFIDAIKNTSFPENATFIKMQQVHGNIIEEVDKIPSESIIEIPGTDACFTSQKNLFLSVKTADCLPILIHGIGENDQGFVAAAHAGRKGTQKEILYKLLEKLKEKYKFVKTSNELYIWFGPAICFDCYQIDKETDLHYDLIEENKKQITKFCEKYGFDEKNHLKLEILKKCTLHENNNFYSYRACGPGVKMNYSFIGIV